MSNLSEEEKEAIKELKEEINKPVEIPEDKFDTFILFNIESAKTVLNYIDRLQKELDKKDKVIDLMAEVLNNFDYDKQCENCRTDICTAVEDRAEYMKCIKEYFYKQVEVEDE